MSEYYILILLIVHKQNSAAIDIEQINTVSPLFIHLIPLSPLLFFLIYLISLDGASSGLRKDLPIGRDALGDPSNIRSVGLH